MSNQTMELPPVPTSAAPKVQFPKKFKGIFEASRYKCWYGGRGCQAPTTLIDTPDGQVMIKDFNGGLVHAADHKGNVITTYAGAAVKYQSVPMFEITFSNGVSLTTTDNHRFLTPEGWTKTCDLVAEQSRVAVAHPRETLSSADVQYSMRIVLGFLYGYLEDLRHDGELPLRVAGTYLDVVRTLGDVLSQIRPCTNSPNHSEDGLSVYASVDTYFLSHLSNLFFQLDAAVQDCGEQGSYDVSRTSELSSELFRVLGQSLSSTSLGELVREFSHFVLSIQTASSNDPVGILAEVQHMLERDVDDGSYSDSFVDCIDHNPHYITATSITQVEDDNYYDFFVPVYNNYLTSGIVNHNSGKSVAAAQALILLSMRKKCRILCCREIQKSIQESVIKLIADKIEAMGLLSMFEIQKSTIRGANGSDFIFTGLKNNITSIKSLEGVDYVWVEEAESVTEESWDILVPTIRKQNSEIWVTFNPYDEQDPTYQMFVVNPPKDCVTVKVNYMDNPYFPDVLRREMEQMKENNYKKYLHIWEGEPSVDFEDSLIQPEWVRASIDAHVKIGFAGTGVISTGFDPADRGGDNKAIATRWGSVITEIRQWVEGGIEEAVDKAFSYAYDARADHVVYDSVGVGAAVQMGLEDRVRGKHIVVDPFGGGETPDNPSGTYRSGRKANKDMFRNKRAQYWWYLRDRFEATYNAVEHGKYTDPSELISLSSEIDPDVLNLLKGELTRVQRKRTRSGSDHILLESKEDMRLRGVKSPGMADALAMCFANSMPFGTDPFPDELVPEYTEYY